MTAFLNDFSLTGIQDQGDLFGESHGGGTLVDELTLAGARVPRFTNEFWTAGQRQGHSLHEISYRACFKPQLPEFFIKLLLGETGGIVYDPFMGRGTTLLQAALMGCGVIGNDVNPLSRILLEPRLDPPEPAELADRLRSIDWKPRGKYEIDLTMFYSPETLRQLLALREHLEARRREGTEDRTDRWIRMVATNRLSGHSAGFFSVYTLPPNQAVSPEAQTQINARRGQTPPVRDVPSIILRKSKSLLRGLTSQDRVHLRRAAQHALFLCQDAGAPLPLAEGSIDLVITSPPFLDVVQYAKDNWLRCWFNGIDAEAIGRQITMEKTTEGWAAAMGRVFRAIHPALRGGGWVAFEVGEVRNGTINLDEVVAPIAMAEGFACEAIVVNQQEFTKTANCWGVNNNSKGTNSNRIVLLRAVK